jgi:hypothetical protein
MMTTRKAAVAPNGGELATLAKIKDRLILGLVAVAVALMSYFAHDNAKHFDDFKREQVAAIVAVRAEIAELRTRMTADQNASSGQSARFGAQGEEALRRLDGIDKKLDALVSPRRRE